MANVFDQFDTPQGGSGNVFDQFDQRPQADPQIGNPQELTFAERYIAPILDKLGTVAQSGNDDTAHIAQAVLNNGNLRGSVIGGMMQGAADPGTKIVQLAANAVGQGDAINKAVQNEEQQYQQARAEAGRGGWDLGRAVGNAVITAPVGAIGGAPTSLLGLAGKGALQGAVTGALQPVANGGNVFAQTAKDAGIGALTGGIMGLGFGGLSRVVSPKASVNPDLELLRNEGVTPTVGQALGGAFNAMEEKAQSIPIVGDAIAASRSGARKSFNNAVINRGTNAVGQSVEGSGFKAINESGNLLSDAYDSALNRVQAVGFDTPQFNADLQGVQQTASGLVPTMRRKFNDALNNIVYRRMDPASGVMTGDAYKAADSELGQLARQYMKSSTASEQELGDVLSTLRDSMRGQLSRTDPVAGQMLDAADLGWANLVQAERAARSAKNAGGVFTPAQYNSAIDALDSSVRHRAVARGQAFNQDLGNAAESIIGNKVADSGTVGRALMASGALASAVVNPAIPAALVGGAALYARPIQNALVSMIAKRPQSAPAVANYLRLLTGPATLAAVPVATSQ